VDALRGLNAKGLATPVVAVDVSTWENMGLLTPALDGVGTWVSSILEALSTPACITAQAAVRVIVWVMNREGVG
jgi:hypothetical protein